MKHALLGLCMVGVIAGFSQQNNFHIEDWRTLLSDSVVDLDGNVYSMQKLGEQTWLVENLKVTRFNNGDSISHFNDSLAWTTATTPAYCNLVARTFFSDSTGLFHKDKSTDELLYNGYVVIDDRNVCPRGWHVPDTEEWSTLEHWIWQCNSDFMDQFGDSTSAWFGKSIWSLDLNFTGLSFSNQAFGYRLWANGEFSNYGDYGYWWSGDAAIFVEAWDRILYDRGFGVDDLHVEDAFGAPNIKNGFSVRCIKD